MKQGAILINLGSPNSTSIQDVRKYLREFLMDKRVIDIPFLIRKMIVELFILPKRPKQSAENYRKIWTNEGSPLVVISQKLTKKVAQQLPFPVVLAMRYGNPTIKNAMQQLYNQGIRQFKIFSLYPQFAMSTTETVEEKVKEIQQKSFKDCELVFNKPFYNNAEYIKILSEKIKHNLPKNSDVLLFSYHGIPQRHIYKTDKTKTCAINNCCFIENLPSHARCYRHQCYVTTKSIQKYLGFDDDKVMQTFQSRLGKDPWLQPYTDFTLEKIAKTHQNIAIVAPAFVADCLETLEEIAQEGKHIFIENGGKNYYYIPCLNDDDAWATFVSEQIKKM